MRLTLTKADIETPTDFIQNALVDLASDDDETMIATVNDRRGVTLAVFTGPFDHPADRQWSIETAEGLVMIFKRDGCGCGGTSTTARQTVAGA